MSAHCAEDFNTLLQGVGLCFERRDEYRFNVLILDFGSGGSLDGAQADLVRRWAVIRCRRRVGEREIQKHRRRDCCRLPESAGSLGPIVAELWDRRRRILQPVV